MQTLVASQARSSTNLCENSVSQVAQSLKRIWQQATPLSVLLQCNCKLEKVEAKCYPDSKAHPWF